MPPRNAALVQPTNDVNVLVARIEADGRAIRAEGTRFVAEHPAANLAAVFDADGAHFVEPGTGRGRLTMRARTIGREDATRPVGAAPYVEGGCAASGEVDTAGECLVRVDANTAGLVERWESARGGFEHSFEVSARDPGEGGEVAIQIGIDGARAARGDDETAVHLLTQNGPVYRYSALHVSDAGGRTLPSRFDVTDGELRIVFDDAEAEYPVLVDPVLSSTASASFEGDQPSSEFGFSIAGAGDIDADGFDDVLIGAPNMTNGQSFEGVVYVYRGSSTGLTHWVTLENDLPNTKFGTSVAAAGDVDNDGFADVLIGQPRYSNVQTNEGRVWIYRGSATGLLPSPSYIESNVTNALFGSSVAGAGDVDKDGYGDIVVGGPGGGGRAQVHRGSATGIATNAAASWTTIGSGTEARGSVVAGAGDVNCDGYADIIVASTNGTAGAARVFRGTNTAAGIVTTPIWSVVGTFAYRFAAAISSAGDVDGNGCDDIVVGSPAYDGNGSSAGSGRVQTFHGSTTGLSTTASLTFDAGLFYGELGSSVAPLGDTNDDGFDEILVGAPGTSLTETEGRAVVLRGSWNGSVNSIYGSWTSKGTAANQRFGSSVAGLGDFDGDGQTDGAVGASNYSNPQANEGRVLCYSGTQLSSGLATGYSTGVTGTTGGSVVIGSAGDVNADGFDDALVGLPNYDGSFTDQGRVVLLLGSEAGLVASTWEVFGPTASARLGSAVTSAGDVNGDGYGDVAIGAPLWKVGSSQRGAVLVFMGGPSGLSTTPAATLLGDQGLSLFGASIAGDGDENGDGYSDLVVGAYREDGMVGVDEGGIFLYLGSSAGIGTTPTWSWISGQQFAVLGQSLAYVGDLNLDGCDDVVVGSSTWDDTIADQGAAIVTFGQPSTAGLYPLVAMYGPFGSSRFGTAVSGAGDVDRDGIPDIAVSQPSAAPNTAAVYVYRGSTTWPFVDTTTPYVAYSATAGTRFGASIALVGNDRLGTSRIAVGVPDFDNASLGLTNSGAIVLLSLVGGALVQEGPYEYGADLNDRQLGVTLAGLGDTTGDGEPDIGVGVTTASTGVLVTGPGSPFSDGSGSLRNADVRVGTAGVVPGGLATSDPYFRVQTNAAIGRTLVLEVEVRPLGTAFSAANYFSASVVSTSITTILTPQATLSGLASGDYHVRARLRSKTSGRTPERTRWVYGAPTRGNPNGIDFRRR